MDVKHFRLIINSLKTPVFLMETSGKICLLNSIASKTFSFLSDLESIDFDDIADDNQVILKSAIRSWSRTSSPLPSRINFKSENKKSETYLCFGSVAIPKSKNKSSILIVRCEKIEQSHKEFLSLNKRIERLNQEISDRQKAEKEILRLNSELEERVKERTIKLQTSNKELKTSINNLKSAQNKLIQSERLASLGGIVAGVAHEINNPVGVCVTASSFLNEQVAVYQDLYQKSELTRECFESFMEMASKSTNIINTNLERASNLLRSFKQLAVDQTSDQLRELNLKEYINEVLASLEPYLKNTSHVFKLDCPNSIYATSFPGALSQIIHNFVSNSLFHGFENVEFGIIEIKVRTSNDRLTLSFSDNGGGIAKENRKKIFDPFFTTKRNQGGSGLGLNIVYNLVRDKLQGSIELIEEKDIGSHFSLTIPNNLSVE